MTRNTQQLDNGVSLSYLDRGHGDPILVIHGFTGTAESNLGNLIRILEEDFRVIGPDLRGYGSSRPPNRDFPPDFYQRDAADLALLLDRIQPGRVIVLGFSDGAEVAILLAALRPDRIQGVVAWGVSGVISPEELASVERWLPVTGWGPEREEWKQEIIALHGEEQFEPMITGWVEAARAIISRGGNICYDQAANIHCPVLLLNGDGEVGNTPRDVRRLASRIPNSRLEFISGSGHAIQRDQPEILIRYVRAFIQDLPA